MKRKYVSEDRAEELYDDMLDECYPEMFGLRPSYILKELDPIQYNCGFTDWLDASDYTTEEEDDEE